MGTVKTVRIRDGDGHRVIRASDFDPSTMELLDEETAPGPHRGDSLRAHLCKAGKARMAKLSTVEHSSLARKGGLARWRKTRKPAGKMRPVEVRLDAGWAPYPSMTAAAKEIGVSRSTLYCWLCQGKVRYQGEPGPPPAAPEPKIEPDAGPARVLIGLTRIAPQIHFLNLRGDQMRVHRPEGGQPFVEVLPENKALFQASQYCG